MFWTQALFQHPAMVLSPLHPPCLPAFHTNPKYKAPNYTSPMQTIMFITPVLQILFHQPRIPHFFSWALYVPGFGLRASKNPLVPWFFDVKNEEQ